MHNRLRFLSRHLTEASTIISTFVEKSDGSHGSSSTSSISPSTTTTSTSITSSVGAILSRARAMSNGAFSRLNRRERLRAQSNQRQPANPSKRQKKQEKKVLEFVLVDVRESEGESWSFSEDIVLLR